MDLKDVQERLKNMGLYKGSIDGISGDMTKDAVNAFLLYNSLTLQEFQLWLHTRRFEAARQGICKIDGIEVGKIDGLVGPQTRHALSVWDARKPNGGKPVPGVENWRNDETAPEASKAPLPTISSSQVNPPSTKPVWPKQSQMDSFYGNKGANQTPLKLPYRMRIAWETGSTVSQLSCHHKVHESLERIFVRTLDYYGADEIKRLRLDLYGGCLNVRRMRGSTAWSIHSWGCAVDIDPDHNALKTKKPQATLSRPEYGPWWSFVYDEGAIGLGRERDYDWMHFQFARL